MNNISSINSLLSSISGTSASISGKDSSVSSLLNSLNSSDNTSNASSFNGVNLSDYSSIKSGSYYKLLKTYYNRNSTSVDTSAVVSKIKSAANGAGNVVSSLNELKNASFAEKDRDKLTTQITDFVDDYNTMVSSATNTDSKNILQKTKWLTNMTKEFSEILSEAGISVGSDNRLSLNKDTLGKVNESTLKELFSGASSYASKVLYKAEQIYSLAMTGGSSATAYTSKANYLPSGTSSFNTTT